MSSCLAAKAAPALVNQLPCSGKEGGATPIIRWSGTWERAGSQMVQTTWSEDPPNKRHLKIGILFFFNVTFIQAMANRGKSVKGTRYSRAGWAALNTLGAKVVKMFWEDLDLVIPRWRWWLSTDPGNNQTMNNGSRKFSANVLEEEFLPLPTWHAGPACRHRTSSQSRVRALA